MTMLQATNEMVTKPVTKLARKMGKRKTAEPVIHEDPRVELRRLVEMHRRYVENGRRILQMTQDITIRATGEIRKSHLSQHEKDDLRASAKLMAQGARGLEPAMLAQLRQVPIYQHFLSRVFGMKGPVISAYIVAMVRIEKAPNVSNLIRYCGNACDPKTGRREIRHSAPKEMGGEGTYNDQLKMRLWQGMTAMRKCGAKVDAKRPFGTTTKYLERWADAVHTRRTTGREKGADAAGRRKATDLFLWDLYVMWRTLDGLSIRPDKYSAIRGRYHNGQEARDTTYLLTLEEALAMVGDAIAGRPATRDMFAREDVEADDASDIDLDGAS